MIKGAGIDIFDIDRVSCLPHVDSFTKEILSDNEIAELDPDDLPRQLSSRFTGKEAVLKALGCGLRPGSFWKEIEISKDYAIKLKNKLKKIADNKAIKSIYFSCASTKSLSLGLVIIEDDQ